MLFCNDYNIVLTTELDWVGGAWLNQNTPNKGQYILPHTHTHTQKKTEAYVPKYLVILRVQANRYATLKIEAGTARKIV